MKYTHVHTLNSFRCVLSLLARVQVGELSIPTISHLDCAKLASLVSGALGGSKK